MYIYYINRRKPVGEGVMCLQGTLHPEQIQFIKASQRNGQIIFMNLNYYYVKSLNTNHYSAQFCTFCFHTVCICSKMYIN